jgi:hypothetical protein
MKVYLRWRGFIVFLVAGVGVLCCSVIFFGRGSGIFGGAGRIVAPLGRLRDSAVPMAHAHEGWVAMRAFESYMDSLRVDSAGPGRARYDSILRCRPGILDSVRKAEELFYFQEHMVRDRH